MTLVRWRVPARHHLGYLVLVIEGAHLAGLNHSLICSTLSGENTRFGTLPCTAFAGTAEYAEPVWFAYWVTRKLAARLHRA
jgi:hypothetical protein